MVYSLSGYTPYTGQDLSVWASGNNAFFSGVYGAIVDLDERVLANTADLLNKVGPGDPLLTNLITVNSTFRFQMADQMGALERKMDKVIQALSSVRTTLNEYNDRLDALE